MSSEPGAFVEVADDRTVRCERCGRRIEVCAFCQDPECIHVICYDCLRTALRQSVDQPHAHGG